MTSTMLKIAIADAILTIIWISIGSFLKLLTIFTSTSLGIESIPLASLFISTIFNTILVITCSLIGNILGGASFNPSASLTQHTAGLNPNSSVMSFAVRFPAQAVGGVSGVKLINQLMPLKYKNVLKGPVLKVGSHSGAGIEGALSFLRCFALLVIMIKGPKSLFVRVWLVGVVTVVCVIVGGGYTGAAMNPATAHGWAYFGNWHNSWEFFYVYWVSPLFGAAFAGWLYRFVSAAAESSSSVVKQKKVQ